MKRFIIYTIVLLIGRYLDMYTTYVGSPDLTLEANLLVRQFNLGWWALILLNSLLVILITGVLYHYYVSYLPALRRHGFKNLRSYISNVYFNEEGKFYKALYAFPVNKKPFFIHLFLTTSILYIVSTLLFIVNNCMVIYLPARYYALTWQQHISPFHMMAVLIVLCMIMIFRNVFRHEFQATRLT